MNILTRNVPRQYLRNGDLNLAEGGIAYYSTGIGGMTGGYLPALPMEEGGYLVEDPITFLLKIIMKSDLDVEGNTLIDGNLNVEGDSNLKNTNIDGDINITGKILVNGEEFEGGGGGNYDLYRVYVDNAISGGVITVTLDLTNEAYAEGTVRIYGLRYEDGELKDDFSTVYNINIYKQDSDTKYKYASTGVGIGDNVATHLCLNGSDSLCIIYIPVDSNCRVTNIGANFSGISSSLSSDNITGTGNKVTNIDINTYSFEDLSNNYFKFNIYSYSSKLSNLLIELGITATPEEINILDGALITTDELNTLLGSSENIQDLFDEIFKRLKELYDYLSMNVPLTPEKGHIFFDHDQDLVISIANPPIYQVPIPEGWDGYTNVKCEVGIELSYPDAFWGICMEFEDGLWPKSAEIWVEHNEIWGRIYLFEGLWYADKNAAEWFEVIGYAETAGASGEGYVDLYTDSVGAEFKNLESIYGTYNAYVKADGLVNVSYRETMPYFNLQCDYWGYNYTVTDEVFASDTYYLANDNPVHKLYGSNNIDLIGIDKDSTSTETKFLNSLTINNEINLSTSNNELIISTGRINGFYTAENTDIIINNLNAKIIEIDELLGDIEVALDGILGYENTSYIEETLTEILIG